MKASRAREHQGTAKVRRAAAAVGPSCRSCARNSNTKLRGREPAGLAATCVCADHRHRRQRRLDLLLYDESNPKEPIKIKDAQSAQALIDRHTRKRAAGDGLLLLSCIRARQRLSATFGQEQQLSQVVQGDRGNSLVKETEKMMFAQGMFRLRPVRGDAARDRAHHRDGRRRRRRLVRVRSARATALSALVPRKATPALLLFSSKGTGMRRRSPAARSTFFMPARRRRRPGFGPGQGGGSPGKGPGKGGDKTDAHRQGTPRPR